MKNLTIKSKLIGLVVLSLVILSSIILFFSLTESKTQAKSDKLAQLSSITSAKKQHIENYFKTISGLIVSVANTTTSSDALYYMGRFFKNLEQYNEAQLILDEGLDLKEVKNKLIKHYEEFYLNDINFNLSNVDKRKMLLFIFLKQIMDLLHNIFILKKIKLKLVKRMICQMK